MSHVRPEQSWTCLCFRTAEKPGAEFVNVVIPTSFSMRESSLSTGTPSAAAMEAAEAEDDTCRERWTDHGMFLALNDRSAARPH